MGPTVIRVVRFVALGALLVGAAALVGFSIWRPSLPDIPTAAAAAQELEHERLVAEQERLARERAFWARIALAKQADRLSVEFADQEAHRKAMADQQRSEGGLPR